MNIYKVTQNVNSGYDTYDGFIICAKDEEAARNTNPTGLTGWYSEAWVPEETVQQNVKVELIGIASKGTPEGIVLSSFNAG